MPPRSTKASVIGDVLDHAVDHLSLRPVSLINSLRCSARVSFEHRAAGNDDYCHGGDPS